MADDEIIIPPELPPEIDDRLEELGPDLSADPQRGVTPPTTYSDAPWKAVFKIEPLLFAAIKLMFPEVFAQIDTTKPVEYLDTELLQYEAQSATGKRIVDLLFKVHLLDGTPTVLFVHIDVQGQYDAEFGRRLWEYYRRLTDTHGDNVITLVVLADKVKSWRPDTFEVIAKVFVRPRVIFRFEHHKLIDWLEPAKWAELENSGNIFAPFLMAYLKARQTVKDSEARLLWKIMLTDFILKNIEDRKMALRLARMVNWQMPLTHDYQKRYKDHRAKLEEKKMTLMSMEEREVWQAGAEKGHLEGRVEGERNSLKKVVQIRFGGDAGEMRDLMALIDAIQNESALNGLIETALTAQNFDEFVTAAQSFAARG